MPQRGGVGAALRQKYGEEFFPDAYASKQLLPREQKYSTMKRECR